MRWSGVRLVPLAGFLVLAALAALPSASSAKQVEKKVGATILYLDATRPGDADNCGTWAVLQWKDPTKNNFVGSSWEAHYFVTSRGVPREEVKQASPPFDNQITFLGVDFIATGGNNWLELGGGWRDGGVVGAGQAKCAEYHKTLEGIIGSQAWVIVTGEEDKSDSVKCKKAEKALKKAVGRVRAAQKQKAAAKSAAGKARAQTRLTNAKAARARAAAAVGKACNG